MKVEYLNCDICGNKIDSAATDRAIGKFEIVRVRETIGVKGPLVPLSPFQTEKIGDVSQTEVMERVTIDMCEKCTKSMEESCTAKKEKHDKETKNK